MSETSGRIRTDDDPFDPTARAPRSGAHAAEPERLDALGADPLGTEPLVVPNDGGLRDDRRSGGGATDEAKQQGRQVADDARAKGQQVAGTAKEQAGQVTDEAKGQAKGLLDSARSELSSQASTQTKRAASELSSLGDQLSALVSGEPEDGQVLDLARQAEARVHEAARWMDGREPADLLQDVTRFARRRPGTFLAVAAGVGILAGRFTRGAAADAKDDTDNTLGSSDRAGTSDPSRTDGTTGAGSATGTTGGLA